MTNVLIEGISHIASYDLTVKDFVRFAQVLPISIRAKLTRDITWNDISWCDILVCVRANNPLSAWIAEKAYRKGRKVILSIDDDLFSITSIQHPHIDAKMKQSLKKVLSVSSCIITTSQILGEKYKAEYNVDYVLSDTVFQKNEIRKLLPSDGKVKMVYAAAAGHIYFFNKLIAPILDRLYDKYGDSISLTVIGPAVKIEDYKMKMVYVPSMAMDDYQKYMMSHHFDIGLAPLENSEFCRAKYFNKYLEYSKNNIFGIYSNQMPYINVIRNGENGLLADGTPDSWFSCICRAIEDCNMRTKGVLAAQSHLVTNFNLSSIANRLSLSIPDLTTYKAPVYKTTIPYFMYVRFVIYEVIRRTMLKIRRNN